MFVKDILDSAREKLVTIVDSAQLIDAAKLLFSRGWRINMAIEHIKLSKKAKDQLVRLKVVTGIQQWNILCRWAFCISLAERSTPSQHKIVTDSNVEMSWKVFGGDYADIYYAILKERCLQDGFKVDEASLAEQFKLHLHRGISYLAGNKKVKGIKDMVLLVA